MLLRVKSYTVVKDNKKLEVHLFKSLSTIHGYDFLIKVLTKNQYFYCFCISIPPQVLILNFCPESPQFLLLDKRDTQSVMDALERLRGEGYCIEGDIGDMILEYEDARKYSQVCYADFFQRQLVSLFHFY